MAERKIPNAESTDYPVWGIVNSIRTLGWCAGPWFSREAAEEYLEANRRNFGRAAEVYCFSGHASADYRHLCETGEVKP